jgi:hypothetical protein
MPVKRLGVIAPAAATDTLLATVDVAGVASIIITNRAAVTATVSVWVNPIEGGGAVDARVYVVANLAIAPGQTYETFRFAVTNQDTIYVVSDNASVSFSSTAAYEIQGRSQVLYQATQPGFPQVGDIWVDSTDNAVYFYTGNSWNEIVTVAPIGPTGPEGPTGPTGPIGITGPTGYSVSVLGTYVDVTGLTADNTT